MGIKISESASALREANLFRMTSEANCAQPEFPMVGTPGYRGLDGERGAVYRTVMTMAAESFWIVKLVEVVEFPKGFVLNYGDRLSVKKWPPVEFFGEG
jgi:hypothetical protein